MQSIEILRRQFTYNEWANGRVLESLKASSDPSPKATGTFAHLLIAEKTWMARLQKNEDSTGFNFWPGASLEECEAMASETKQAYRTLLDHMTEEELDRTATYKNSKGVEYRTSYRDILTHVLMHSAYHRGQVAMSVRAEGGTPAYTDYIAFVREIDNK